MASKVCKVCEDLQEKAKGSAPPRQHYNLPTCYDHMESFSKFKHSRELEKLIRKKKTELITQNEKFTNLKIAPDRVDEVLLHFSSAHINSFKEKMKKGTIDITELNSIAINEPKSKESLNYISRSPIICPCHSCAQTIGITSVLSHFLRDHQKLSHAVSYQEIIQDQKSKIEFNTKYFRYNEVICLGVLVYGGREDIDGERPAQLGICRPNSFLPERYQNLVHHLPILVMGAKTCLSRLLDDQELSEQFYDPDDPEKEIIILWLATVETTKTIHCTLTVYDKIGLTSRSTIIQVRNLKDSQDPKQFLSKDTNYLMLNYGEINILTNENNNSTLFTEIYIHEYNNNNDK